MDYWKFSDIFDDKEYEFHENNVTQGEENENWEDDNKSIFSTDMVFNYRKDLVDWVQSTGRRLGYVIVIKRSDNSIGKAPKILFQCDRGGIYKSDKISTRNTGTKKTDCPFRLEAKFKRVDDGWRLRVLCETHNHDPALHMEDHLYPKRLSKNEALLVDDLTRKNVKPRAILSTRKEQNQDIVSTLKTIYNARYKFRVDERAGMSHMQLVMSFLQKEGYDFQSRANSITNELEDLFFAHPNSLEIWRAFSHALLIDATYKTNKYKMPLLEIVGVTSTNMTFCIAFVFMHGEKKRNYEWALNCLKPTLNGCTGPRVIVTDRELALMNACKNVFPEAKGLLCRWHISRSILKKCRPSIPSIDSWNSFTRRWTRLVESETIEKYRSNLAQLEAMFEYPVVRDYINDYWLDPYKEMFVSAWTDKFLNFENHTTNRVESQHFKLKKYLETSNAGLKTSLSHIHKVVESQITSIKASLEHSKIIAQHKFSVPHFQELRGFVSIYALEIISKEYKRSQCVGVFSENCGCQLRTSHGLPCAHELVIFSNQGLPLPLDSVDKFWRKLDLFPSLSQNDDDVDCTFELKMFDAQFKQKPRCGKFSILRKLREIIAPSTTLINDPAVHTTTRGRPSLKEKILKKNCADIPVAAQEPNRHSCSCTSRFVHRNDFQFQEPARHGFCADQRYSSHSYIHQFPLMLHPYITQVQDVKSDGNCGFRAIALCLGFQTNEWPTIRKDLMEELVTYTNEYVNMFGTRAWNEVYNRLDFFRLDMDAREEHWMSMPEMGVLCASKYNVILHVLSNLGSVTHLPLRSCPPPWYQHVAIAIGHVNGNHYIKVSLTGGYPMPTVTPHWLHFRYDCASAWATPYKERINTYERYLRKNCTEFVVLE